MSLDILQYYQIQAVTYLTSSGEPSSSNTVISTRLKATDTFRNGVLRLIYLISDQNIIFPYSGSDANSVLGLFLYRVLPSDNVFTLVGN